MDIFGNFSQLLGDKNKRTIRTQNDLEFSYSEVTDESIGKVESKSSEQSFLLPKLISILIFSILVYRLFFVQVVHGDINQKLAEGNRIRPRVLEASRGLIVDSNGQWLARNKPSFALAIYPSDLPKKKNDRQELYQKISELSGISVDQIKKDAEKNGLSSLDEVLLKEDISHDDALLLEENITGLPGVFIAKKSIREYKGTSGLSHLIGYSGIVSGEDLKKYPSYYLSDRIGKVGLEAEYESFLRGTYGVEQIEVDSKGNIAKVLVDKENKDPVAGDDLVLNIDLGLQEKAAAALRAGIDSGKEMTGTEVTGGAAIVMDVKTGGILSMVSLPDYDNNLFTTKISDKDYQGLMSDASLPMFNRSIGGVYPPGSISKIIMASAGLSEGNITKNTSFVTPAEIRIGDYGFPDWKDHSYETTDVERALAESNNVFFYSIGGGYDKIKGIGIDAIKHYWELFGLGEKTGIDLPGEATGLLPDATWKKTVKNEPWYIGDTYHVSIGQGDLLVTPLQMLRATAVIASGGKLYEPQLVKKIIGPDGAVISEFAPRIERQDFISSDVIKTVAEGMRMAVTEGSARTLSDLPIKSAGKTGTAQFLNNQKTHAWFTCFAPYEDPQIAVIVLVDGGGGGHEIALPVAKEILNYYFTR
jgi:penicillin-binding protein 2